METRRARTRIALGLMLAIGSMALGPAVLSAAETAATETPVTIPGEGHDIPGILALPAEGESVLPAVLLLHGYGSDKNEVGLMYTRLAEALAGRGVASLRIDFAGMGESTASTLDYTYDSQVSDAAAAFDWLAGQPGIDGQRVGVQGFSLGSLIGAHLAGTDPQVAAFGSWSGAIYDGYQFFYGPDTLDDCEAGGGHLDMDLGWRTLDHSCDFFTSMMGSTALTDLAPYAHPFLLVAGTADTSVDPAVSENAATATASDDVTLEMIEGADHIYNVLTEDQTLADQVIGLTADWYAEKLGS